jgi:homoserine dehydrogenase
VAGITGITGKDIQAAAAGGRVIKLIGRVEKSGNGIQISVSPERLPADHPLAQVSGSEKAVSYLTDTMDRITVMGGKSSPSGAAAAILKDLINAYSVTFFLPPK